MPIINDSFYYSIPQDIVRHIDFEFCETMLKELHLICGVALEDFDYDSVGYIEGTGGWYEAFVNSCRKLQKDELLVHYISLDWYESDLFDEVLTNMMVSYKLLLPTFASDEVARQNGFLPEDVAICDECGELFNKNELLKISECSEDHDAVYLCRKCKNDDENHPLILNKERAIKELLGVDSSKYFTCEYCGKIHYNYNKGKKFCLYCEETERSENKNANNYYRGNMEANEKYVRSLVPEIISYKDYEAEIRYSYEDDVFYGKIIKYKGKDVTDLVSFHDKLSDNIRKQFEDAVEDYIEIKKQIGKE